MGKKLFFLYFLIPFVAISYRTNGQGLACPTPPNNNTITVSPTTIICNGGCGKIGAAATATVPATNTYTIDSFPYNPYPYNGGTAYQALGDDVYGPLFNLPFPICFFGNSYTQCLIGSNGEVGFDLSLANSGITWTYGAIPSTQSGEIGSVMYPYMDIYFPDGGTIYTATYGTAPCRVFVVSGDSCSYFDAGDCPTQYITSQAVFHESTNQIDVNIKHKDVCTNWNSGNATLGIENIAGTVAYPIPGKNGSDWTADSLSYSFLPAGTAGGTVTYEWYDHNHLPVGSTDSVTICPTTSGYYYVVATIYSGCDTFTIKDSVDVLVGGGPDISSYNVVEPSTCGACDGKIILHGLVPFQPDTIYYAINGVNQPPQIITSWSDSTVTLINLCAATYSNITAKYGVCSSNVLPPVVLDNPPITAGFSYIVKYGCHGDTVVYTNLSSSPGATTINYTWKFGDGSIDTATNPTHIFLTQGTYTTELYISNTTCEDSTNQSIPLIHPIKASFTVSKDTICQGTQVNFTNTSIGNTVPTPPTYLWTFGDGNTSTLTNPSDIFLNYGVYVVKLVETDFVPCVDSAFYTVYVDSLSFNYFTTSDSVICLGKEVIFTGFNVAEGQTSTVWNFGDSTIITNRNPISYAYGSTGIFHVVYTANYRVCPDTSFSEDLTVLPYPVANIGPDTALCPGSGNITITDIANINNNAVTWLWNTGATTPSIVASTSGTYYVTVSQGGCSTTDSMFIGNDCYLDIPNAFTPNGDGVNDYFMPRQLLSSGLTSFKMEIFDRWGELLFQTTNIDGRGWDGRFNGVMQPQGVFVYMIDASFKDGSVQHYNGNVTLLR